MTGAPKREKLLVAVFYKGISVVEVVTFMKLSSWDIAIIATSLLVLIGTVFTVNTEFPWVGQDLAGVPSLLFLVASIIIGAMIAGKLGKPQGANLFSLHRKISVFFTALIVVTFIHGLYDRIAHGEQFFWQHTEPLVTVVHGWLGLLVTVLALAQVVPSFATKDRRKIKRLHMVLGYSLLVLVLIQIFLGIWTVVVESVEG